MSVLRPERAAALAKRREVLVWAAALGLGAALALRGLVLGAPLVLVAGLALGLVGAALLRGALLRARLADEGPGPGLVTIDEGRIAFFGPTGGGFVDLGTLVAVDVVAGPGGRAWALAAADGTRLVVPFGAVGAAGLPDALAALPGLDLAAAGPGPVWRRDAADPALALPRGGR